MDFLKSILGEELYEQVKARIDRHNGDEANVENQIKLANLSSGEYVGKGKHDSLQALFDSQKTELETANSLIAELKKGTADNSDLQSKIENYETQVTDLQNQLAETKLKSAIKVALLSEKAVDPDYLIYKLHEKLDEKGEKIELDSNDNIKGWNEIAEGLKTQFPNQFEASEGSKNVIENKLGSGSGPEKLTKAEILKMPYSERNRLYTENPEAFNEAMKG